MKIKPLHQNFEAPTYGSAGAAAFDIRTPEDFTLFAHTPRKIHLGFAAEVPEGYVAVIAPRSGLGCNHGMALRNSIGIIDSDYRGEWQATITLDMFNGADNTQEFKAGDRILQCMILPVSQVGFEIVNELDETDRGEGGFGSTGVD